MLRSLTLTLLTVFLLGCGDGFDDEAFPEDQWFTELAFKRLAKHGELEPVLETGQNIGGWQFRIEGYAETVLPDKTTERTYRLADRSGITYTVTDRSTAAEVFDRLSVGQLGSANGRVQEVTRDLAAGKIAAVLQLTEWTEL